MAPVGLIKPDNELYVYQQDIQRDVLFSIFLGNWKSQLHVFFPVPCHSFQCVIKWPEAWWIATQPNICSLPKPFSLQSPKNLSLRVYFCLHLSKWRSDVARPPPVYMWCCFCFVLTKFNMCLNSVLVFWSFGWHYFGIIWKKWTILVTCLLFWLLQI